MVSHSPCQHGFVVSVQIEVCSTVLPFNDLLQQRMVYSESTKRPACSLQAPETVQIRFEFPPLPLLHLIGLFSLETKTLSSLFSAFFRQPVRRKIPESHPNIGNRLWFFSTPYQFFALRAVPTHSFLLWRGSSCTLLIVVFEGAKRWLLLSVQVRLPVGALS